MPRKIHYQNPNFETPYHACGMGEIPSPEHLTTDINQVTCQRCLGTITGRKSNRQQGDRPKVSKVLRIDADLAEALQQRSTESGEAMTAIIERALRTELKEVIK